MGVDESRRHKNIRINIQKNKEGTEISPLALGKKYPISVISFDQLTGNVGGCSWRLVRNQVRNGGGGLEWLLWWWGWGDVVGGV